MENRSFPRGRFKFFLCESRYLGSALMEWVIYVQGQLGPQQPVVPETQLRHVRPSVTTEMRYTNNRLQAADTPPGGRSLRPQATALLT